MNQDNRFALPAEIEADIARVRARPSEFCHNCSYGRANRMTYELLHNALDEVRAGNASHITVTLHRDFSVTVEDNGSGIPVAIQPDLTARAGRDVSILEGLMTVRDFRSFGNRYYKSGGGKHDLGLAVLNFLSERCEVETRRDGVSYRQWFRKGVPTGPLQCSGETLKTGTKITFRPDDQLIHPIEVNSKRLHGGMRDLSNVNSNVRMVLHDERADVKTTFTSKGLAEDLREKARSLCSGNKDQSDLLDAVHIKGFAEEIEFEIAFQYGVSRTLIDARINNYRPMGSIGIHIAIANALNRYARQANLFSDIFPRDSDYKVGLLARAAIHFPELKYESMPSKLEHAAMMRGLESLIDDYLSKHPESAKAMIGYVLSVARKHGRKPATEAPHKSAEQLRLERMSDLEHVRHRPSTYIGDTTPRGLHFLIQVLVYKAINAFQSGFASSIAVTIHADGSASVSHDGRGISPEIIDGSSVGLSKEVSNLEAAMTALQWERCNEYEGSQSGGLYGVTLTPINFLSEWCKVQVHQNGSVYRQTYRRGVRTGPVSEAAATEDGSPNSGMKITIKPDDEIFPTTVFEFETVKEGLLESAYTNSGVHIQLYDERTDRTEIYCYQNGIAAHIEKNASLESCPDASEIYQTIGSEDGFQYEIGVKYDGLTEQRKITSYICGIRCREGGMNIEGFQRALWGTLNELGRKLKLIDEQVALSYEDYWSGLIVVISTRCERPIFTGATKTQLGNITAERVHHSASREVLVRMFDDRPDIAETLIHRAVERNRLRVQSEADKNSESDSK